MREEDESRETDASEEETRMSYKCDHKWNLLDRNSGGYYYCFNCNSVISLEVYQTIAGLEQERNEAKAEIVALKEIIRASCSDMDGFDRRYKCPEIRESKAEIDRLNNKIKELIEEADDDHNEIERLKDGLIKIKLITEPRDSGMGHECWKIAKSALEREPE